MRNRQSASSKQPGRCSYFDSSSFRCSCCPAIPYTSVASIASNAWMVNTIRTESTSVRCRLQTRFRYLSEAFYCIPRIGTKCYSRLLVSHRALSRMARYYQWQRTMQNHSQTTRSRKDGVLPAGTTQSYPSYVLWSASLRGFAMGTWYQTRTDGTISSRRVLVTKITTRYHGKLSELYNYGHKSWTKSIHHVLKMIEEENLMLKQDRRGRPT